MVAVSSEPSTVAEGTDLVDRRRDFLVLPVSSSGSGGGPSALPSSRAPAKQGNTTPPTLPSRGGSAFSHGKTTEMPQYTSFSAKTCLELLPHLTTEQLNFELSHFKAMGCKLNIVETRMAVHMFPTKY